MIVLSLGCVACVGLVGCNDEERAALGRTDQAPATTAVPGATAAPLPPAFQYGSEVVLLPFDVRLAKVARVAGVSPDDALLKPMRDRRLDLGGYDYALGVKPDTSWTSARLAMWIKALKPVCASPAMHARYSALPEKLPDLVLSAYGRRATDEDRRLVDEALTGAPLDEATRYSAICITVLSSLEFVAR